MKKRRREGGRREVLNPVLSGLTPACFILHSGPGKFLAQEFRRVPSPRWRVLRLSMVVAQWGGSSSVGNALKILCSPGLHREMSW